MPLPALRHHLALHWTLVFCIFYRTRVVYSLGSISAQPRYVGAPGSRGLIGAPPQFNLPRAVQACPWSSSTVLVVDSGNSRVVEVDVQQGLMVKVGSVCVLFGSVV
jgi:hypothetical protein